MAAEQLAPAIARSAPLFGSFVAPLVVLVGRHQPLTAIFGTGLSLVLGKMTFNLGAVPSSFDRSREAYALETLVVTSASNRVVRMLLGATYLHAALGFTTRSAILSGKQAEKVAAANAANGIRQEFTPLFSRATVWSIWRWMGCSCLCFVASIWIFSGYYGQ